MKPSALLPLVLMLALVGCTTTPSDVPADPSYAADIQPIFNGYCISCHNSGAPEGMFALDSYAGATGDGSDTIPNVIPWDADSSKLYRKVAGIETPQMPFGQPPLDTVRIATIRNWINKGAKDN